MRIGQRSPNFEFQLIVNFDVPDSKFSDARLLRLKWNEANLNPCLLVNISTIDNLKKLNSEILNFLKKIKPYDRLRIYIVGHSDGESKKLFSTESKFCKDDFECENDVVANYFARHLQEVKISSAVTFNIFACTYAYGIFASPAADFLRQLNNLKVKAVVVARIRNVMLKIPSFENVYGMKETQLSIKKITIDNKGQPVHKAPGSKIIFRIEKGQMIAEDAYGIKWKQNVLSGISVCMHNTVISEKEGSLDRLRFKIGQQTPHQVLQELKAVVTEKNSFIDKYRYSSFVESYFYKTDTRTFFEETIKTGEEILNEDSLKNNDPEIIVLTRFSFL